METLASICLKVEEISTLLINRRILALVEALEDLEVREAREDEVKNWSHLFRASLPSLVEDSASSPRDSQEINNPSTIPRSSKGSILSVSQALEARSTQPKAILATMVLEDLLETCRNPNSQEALAQRLEVK